MVDTRQAQNLICLPPMTKDIIDTLSMLREVSGSGYPLLHLAW